MEELMSKSVKSNNTEENNKVAPVEDQLPSSLIGEGGFEEEQIDNEDLSLPTIRLTQALSKLVQDGIAKQGEFRHSFDKERVLGDSKTPLEIIPFGKFKVWVIRKNKQFDSIVPVTPENIDWEWEELDSEENVIKREKWFNVYCLIPSEVKQGAAFPAVLSFKGKSYKAVKTFATIVKKLQGFKQPMASRVFKIHCEQDKNEHGTFYKISDVEMGRKTTTQEIKAALDWHKSLKAQSAGSVSVDYEEMEEKEVESQAQASPSTNDPKAEGVAAQAV